MINDPFNQGITVHTRPISSGKRFGEKKSISAYVCSTYIYKSVFTQLTLKLAECIYWVYINKKWNLHTDKRPLHDHSEYGSNGNSCHWLLIVIRKSRKVLHLYLRTDSHLQHIKRGIIYRRSLWIKCFKLVNIKCKPKYLFYQHAGSLVVDSALCSNFTLYSYRGNKYKSLKHKRASLR